MSDYENRTYASKKSANAFIKKHNIEGVQVVENVDDGKWRIIRVATKSGGTKKGRVFEMAQRAGGVTLQAVVDELHISVTAVRSLIGDLKRDKGSDAITYNRETNTYHA